MAPALLQAARGPTPESRIPVLYKYTQTPRAFKYILLANSRPRAPTGRFVVPAKECPGFGCSRSRDDCQNLRRSQRERI